MLILNPRACRFHDGALGVGEKTCTDRCVSKFIKVRITPIPPLPLRPRGTAESERYHEKRDKLCWRERRVHGPLRFYFVY